jgi:signal transduction histidine kinase
MEQEARSTGVVVHRERAGWEALAVPIGDKVVVGRFATPSRWERFVGPSPLSLRLFVVFVVAGLVSLLLARLLTRPLAHLRGAAQRLADGDLSVRVSPQLGRASSEVVALGRDFDRMSERIAGLLEAQQRLLRDVSHELRSPLARLRVALELVRQRAGEGAAAPLDRIEREAERLGELIGHILTVTRLDSLDTLQKDDVDLGALVAEVVRDADYEGKGQGRSVELLAAADCHLPGNSEVLRWAVENVLRNALRFTPEGTAVEVRVSNEDREGKSVAEVVVRDHGPGVPEAELAAIFEPFYRTSTSRDRKTGGTGVGLAITHRGVRLHGGTVRAANAPGGGLVVTLELPT